MSEQITRIQELADLILTDAAFAADNHTYGVTVQHDLALQGFPIMDNYKQPELSIYRVTTLDDVSRYVFHANLQAGVDEFYADGAELAVVDGDKLYRAFTASKFVVSEVLNSDMPVEQTASGLHVVGEAAEAAFASKLDKIAASANIPVLV